MFDKVIRFADCKRFEDLKIITDNFPFSSR